MVHWVAMILLSYFPGGGSSVIIYPSTNIMLYGLLLPTSLAMSIVCFVEKWHTTIAFDLFTALYSFTWTLVALIHETICKFSDNPLCQVDNVVIQANTALYILFGPFIQLFVFNTNKETYAVILLFVAIWLGIIVFTGPYNQYPVYVFITVFQVFMMVFSVILDYQMRTSYTLEISLSNKVEETRKAREAERAVQEAKTQLTNYIFHEIRVPLNTLVLTADLLEHACSTEIELFQALRTGLSSIETVISDVLNFQKISEGHVEFKKEPFVVRNSIETVLQVMNASAASKDMPMVALLDSRMDGLYVAGDEFRFRQVLSNLVSNAIKFNARGKKITVKSELRGIDMGAQCADVYVSVSDQGIGISDEQKKRLFQPFVQIDPEKNQSGKGTGLGLAICANIIAAANGVYGIDSKPGEGATFWFQVRFTTFATTPEQAKRRLSEDASQVAQLPSLHFLVCDDDPTSRMVMERILKSLGSTCRVMSDGSEMVQYFGSLTVQSDCKFDAVLTDNMMDRMSGIDATRWLRAHGWAKLIIVAITGAANFEEERDFYEAGATMIKQKPVNIRVIREIIQWVHEIKSQVA